ncbi:TPR-like protein [Testicularia cyperi]|uniref:TPR-like protein n=1 Tax=Testicularia cyperi TaxID=1882483 RepID=A0A317XF80_9BASI|nr:TPR-like protein [Testicularia cyperi]
MKYDSPRPRQPQLDNLRPAPQTPQTPTRPAQHGELNADGSISVIRNDQDANNSGLLDLSPALTRILKPGAPPRYVAATPPSNPAHTRTRTQAHTQAPRSSLSHHANLAEPLFEQSTDDHANANSSLLHGLSRGPASASRSQRAQRRKAQPEEVPSSQPFDDLIANGPDASSEDDDPESYPQLNGASLPTNSNARRTRPKYASSSTSADNDHTNDAPHQSLSSSSADSLLTRLRRWRQDAMQQHLYETAIFWGSQILSLESSSAAFNDAYHLAQCYFFTHQYARAEHLLTTPLRTGASRSSLTNRNPAQSRAHGDSVTNGASGRPATEILLASDLAHEDGDALAEVLSRTRASAVLPDSIMTRSTTRDSVYSATSSTTGKRKQREFTVTANGTESSGSEERDDDDEYLRAGAGAGRDHDIKVGESDSQMVAEDGSIVIRKAQRRHRLKPGSNRDAESPRRRHGTDGAEEAEDYTEDDVGGELAQIKQTTLLVPDGPTLVNHSLACRYLAAQCQVRLGKYHEALELLGDTEHWGTSAANKTPSMDGGIKLGSSVAYLRGQIHLRLEDLPRAKHAFMAALALDVKNYEAFSALIDGEMLGIKEQWAFVQGLEYVAQAGDEDGAVDDHEFVRLIYTTRLSKQGLDYSASTAAARRRLEADYGLSNDPEVLLGLAEELFARLRFADAFVVTSRILELSADHPATLPIHVACTYHLKNLRPALFMLAHRLTELQPDSAVSWYAVGTWYATTRRWAEARRYFSKASLLDPRFAPSWIAFGHTFAMEGESDQAIIAYSTAARLFPQSHLPKLFVGMEHLHQDNLSLARLSLEGSAAIWSQDPLTANERGIVAFSSNDLEAAATFFQHSIQLASQTQHPASNWKASYLNLGLTFLRLGRDKRAREVFAQVVELDPHNHQAYLSLAMLCHKHDELDDAIHFYHQALSVNPRDAFATELLDFALEEKVMAGIDRFATRYDPQRRLAGLNKAAEQQEAAVAASAAAAAAGGPGGPGGPGAGGEAKGKQRDTTDLTSDSISLSLPADRWDQDQTNAKSTVEMSLDNSSISLQSASTRQSHTLDNSTMMDESNV